MKTKKIFLIIGILFLLANIVNAANPEFINIWNNYQFNVTEDVNFVFVIGANDSDLNYPLGFSDTSDTEAPPMTVFYMRNSSNTNATINFTPTNDDVGFYSFFMIVEDTNDEFTTIRVKFNVTNANDPPNITSYYPTDLNPSVAENSSLGFSFNYSATDPDTAYGDSLTVRWLKNGVNQSSNTTWTYYPNYCEAGSYNITLNVTDSYAVSDTESWNLSVNNTNRVPVLNNTLENISLTEDTNSTNTIDLDNYFYDNDTISCSGSNKDTLIFNITGNNSVKVIINTSDNKVSFNPNPNWFGNETIYFTAYDGYNATASNNITINVTNVNDAPILDSIANQTLAENVSFSLTVTATDPDNNISAGLNTLTFYDNTSLFNINSATGAISFTPSNSDIAEHWVNITVSDGTLNHSRVVLFNATSNYPPILGPIGNQTGEEGTEFTLIVNASDLDNHTLTFASNYSEFTKTALNSTHTRLSFTPDNGDVGNHSVKINVTDPKGASDYEIFNLQIDNINNPPVLDFIQNQSITLNKTFSLSITASDADGDALTFYTNDSRFNVTTINSASGFFNITFNSTDYIGNHTVNITVSDGSRNDSQNVWFHVYNNRPPVFASLGVQNLTEDSIFFLNISANDSDYDELTFGTNSTMFNVTYVNASMAKLNFTPNYSNAGEHNITFNVTDGRFKVNMTVIFNISAVNDVPYFNPILPNFTGMQDVLFTYNINASDEESGSDEVEANLHFWTNATFFTIGETNGLINFTPTNTDVGNHTIKISVNDTVNKNTTVIWFFISQYNDPPNITNFSPNSTLNITENSTQFFNITYNEPDGDSITYSWLLDSVEQSTNANWTYEPGFNSAGNHNITLIISDGSLTDSQYWNATVINLNRVPIFGVKTQSNYTEFTAGTNLKTNATGQQGNITLLRNSSDSYYSSGNFTSSTIDFGAASDDLSLANISWMHPAFNETNITMRARTSSDGSTWGSWSNIYSQSAGDFLNSSSSNRYAQYLAMLSTTNSNKTPVLEEVSISYIIANFTGEEDTVYVNWIDLDNFFSDADGTALNYTSNCSTSSLTVTISSTTNYVTLSPANDWYGTATIVFTANDSSATSTSNIVTLTFTDVSEPSTTVQTPSSGGGGGSTTVIRTQTKLINITEPQFFELVVPESLQTGPNSTIIAPIMLKNDGNTTLEDIDLFASTNTTQVTFEFSKRHFNSLYPKSTDRTNLIIQTHNITGEFTIKVEARVKNPEVKDTAIIQMNLLYNISERVKYVRDLFMLNPECLELNELLIQAQAALQNNEYGKADYMLDQAIEGCKYLLTAGPREFKLSSVTKAGGKLLISILMFIMVIILVFIYYFIRYKQKLKKKKKKEEQYFT